VEAPPGVSVKTPIHPTTRSDVLMGYVQEAEQFDDHVGAGLL
jgi:hypothetical protein